MNAFTSPPSPRPARGDLRPALRLLLGVDGIEATLLLHPVDNDQFEVIEAWPRTEEIGHHIRVNPELLQCPDQDASKVRLPLTFTVAMNGRPARVLTAPVAGTEMVLIALCSRAGAHMGDHVVAGASLLASLADQGAQSTSARLAETKIESIVRSLAVPFVFIDAEASNAFINQGGRALLGLAPAETNPQKIAKALAAMIGAKEKNTSNASVSGDHEAAATFYISHGARTFKADTRWVADGLSGRICTFYDITEERRMEEELRQLATTDHLTGALNRRAFELTFRSELERTRRHGLPLSLILIDLDHFKSINDTYGHPAGDFVLRGVADRIHASLRDSDRLGRLGGEEFGILLPNTDIHNGMEMADRMRRVIGDTPFAVGPGLNVTASAGITCVRNDQDEAEAMTKRADDALYAAKQGGRNRVIEGP
ncbi:diguanylate cyclase [Sphingomonas sp.]|uniref:GGDEF domain-containing protein n=1 Tax=Sphingomonas sp. TaxID=28214 RepID=UPI003B3B2B8E